MRLISFVGGIFGALISYEGFLKDDLGRLICGIILIVLQGYINLRHS